MSLASRPILAFCRPGFETDLIAELDGIGAAQPTSMAPGLIASEAMPIPTAIPVFARDLLCVHARLNELERGDRIGPIAAATAGLELAPAALVMLSPDSEAGRKLAPMIRAVGKGLAQALEIPVATQATAGALYVVFVASDEVVLASAIRSVSNPWPGGVARLKMPRAAPSRSTLKLDEAFALMLDDKQRKAWLRRGMRAVDLGAAPGGWSWQLVNRGIHVTAIDNGPMKGDLLNSGLLVHQRADGFTWRPPQPMDWLVCDMVAKPARVVERIAYWLDQGWCDRALFNLKLPMQRRYASWTTLQQQLSKQCKRALRISARHLYHDREEITVLAWSEEKLPRAFAPSAAKARKQTADRAARHKTVRDDAPRRSRKPRRR